MENKINPNLMKLVERQRSGRTLEEIEADEREEEKSQLKNFPSVEDMIYIPTLNLYFAKQNILQGKSWFESHELLQKAGLTMPTPLEFAQTLKYLRDNPNAENTGLFNELTQVRNPWRSTWLDTYFERRSDGLYIWTGNKTRAEKLDADTLMKDKTISLGSWLDNPTEQGLPRKNVAEGNLYFGNPKKGSVAVFGAGSVGTGLHCGRLPSYEHFILGVHAVRYE